MSNEESEALLKKSVEIACEARDIYYKRCEENEGVMDGDGKIFKHHPVLVAAAVGSYGAYLADGSEYRFHASILYFNSRKIFKFQLFCAHIFCKNIIHSGDYGEGMTLENLKDFHRRRVQVLASSGADLIAFETIPNKLEAQVSICLKCVFYLHLRL